MESYKAYQKARQDHAGAASWVNNKDKIDSQDHKPYDLAHIKFSADYCGQSYAGASNYHKSPEPFNSAMAEVIKARFAELSGAALKLLERDEKKALINCENDLEGLQAAIANAKYEEVSA
tara:strand:+ start:12968 stop:13327 length:360 start_codon:yes stop_codon:yes gene_type:complete